MAAEASSTDPSVFQEKYNEFVDDLLGVFPEYTANIELARALDGPTRRTRFQEEVKAANAMRMARMDEHMDVTNPGTVLPGVHLEDTAWNTLSDGSKKAVWEHIHVLSICCFLESGFTQGNGVGTEERPAWMDDAFEELKKKMESTDIKGMLDKFMKFFQGMGAGAGSGSDADGTGMPGLDKLFESGFPKMPERFLKGHMAKLAQEIVKEITPADLGLTPEMISRCEKDPSQAFHLLFKTFTSDPGIIQRTIMKIGNRLQQKVQSGAIRPVEIAREAEEMMKEFTDNKPFVEMMEGIKAAFGFEDLEMARSVGRESSARLSIARDRLRKKLEKKQAGQKK